jgi:hypothetical protein
MTKFLLGLTVGYLFSDLIDEFLGKQTNGDRAPTPPANPPGETVYPPENLGQPT